MNVLGVQIAGTGASIASLLGLLGFVVALAFLFSIARLKHRSRILAELPSEKRGLLLDSLAARYGLSLEGLSEESSVQLVHKEMDLRFRKQLLLTTLSAAVFVTCFAIVASGMNMDPDPNIRVRTPADEVVLGYMKDVVAVRGDYEARHVNPEALRSVRRDGLRLATLLSNIDDAELNPSRTVIKDEYAGWALLLAARTFDANAPESREERVRHAKNAVELFTSAIRKMEGIKRLQATGDKFAAQDFAWMMGDSADWDRTHFLRAAAQAVAGMAGGPYTEEMVRSELQKVSTPFKEQYPPTNLDEFKWALQP